MDEKVILYLKEIDNIRKSLDISPDEILELVKLSLKDDNYLRKMAICYVNKNYNSYKNERVLY
ncbi:hypothetical protein [Lachnospira sp.]|jgi:hypothetical protein|uniref:hypothetical protein n=1 Tax=Lachnospira sp. TaxID=2049031 RepID=UPI00257AEABC|nr:hypothetical protein [Lachnospira sp.]